MKLMEVRYGNAIFRIRNQWSVLILRSSWTYVNNLFQSFFISWVDRRLEELFPMKFNVQICPRIVRERHKKFYCDESHLNKGDICWYDLRIKSEVAMAAFACTISKFGKSVLG